MASLGKVHDFTKEFCFEWEIKDFFSIPEKDDKNYYSPCFSFGGESWFLEIFPHGSLKKKSVGYVGLCIYKTEPDIPFTLAWSLSLKTSNGKKSYELKSTDIFNEDGAGWGWPQFVKRSTLLEKKSELVPSDVLTIIFTVEFYSKSTDEADRIVEIPECSYCKKGLDVKNVSSHEETCLDRPITCPICKKAVALRYWPEHNCITTTIKEDELMNDFAKILESEEHSDFTVKVKDTEFQLHRSILAARNPYFNSMFKAEMKENTTGVVSINDCEPDIFRSFVSFIYTGKLKTLSQDNVCALYEVADKYQQDRLKAECLRFMKKEISVKSFCDFVVLALRHDENELLQSATDLFSRKTKEIILTVKWQTFLREYPTQANELYIKALDYNGK